MFFRVTRPLQSNCSSRLGKRAKKGGLTIRKNAIIGMHHICIVVGSYAEIEKLYVDLLGMEIHAESYSIEKKRRKIELYLNGTYIIEAFIYDVRRAAKRESDQVGFDHVSFLVNDVEAVRDSLLKSRYEVSPIMSDLSTGKDYAFFFNEDGIKHEIYCTSRAGTLEKR